MSIEIGPEGSGRRVVMIGYEDAQALDVVGPLEVISGANRCVPGAYVTEIWAEEEGLFKTNGGLPLIASKSYKSVSLRDLESVDTLLVAGGEGSRQQLGNPELLSFLQKAAGHVRRIGSICSGSFLLAAAGLLEGKRAATHWSAVDLFRKNFAGVKLDEDAIFIREGNIWTSAGITTGMDMALALVEEDHGRQVALDVAQMFVMFMMRPGGQSQYSAALAAQAHSKGRLGTLIDWVSDNLTADLSTARLADKAAMSERTLLRAFTDEVGETPGKFVERLRLDAARTALTEGDAPIEKVAQRCGFSSAEHMRRAFQRHLGVAPSDYRDRFRWPDGQTLKTTGTVNEQDDRHTAL